MPDDAFTIDNCTYEFRFKCPRAWSALEETMEPGIRFRNECKHSVFRCESADDVERHVRAGRCVAVFRYNDESEGVALGGGICDDDEHEYEHEYEYEKE